MLTWRIPSPMNRRPESSAVETDEDQLGVKQPNNRHNQSSCGGTGKLNNLPFCSFDIFEITMGILCSAPPCETVSYLFLLPVEISYIQPDANKSKLPLYLNQILQLSVVVLLQFFPTEKSSILQYAICRNDCS